MAQTLAEKAVALSETNATLTSQVAEQTAQITSLTAQITDLTAKASAYESDKTSLNSTITALTAERDALAAQIKTLSDTLALAPQVNQPDGVAAVKDVTAPDANATEQPKTWQQALASCKGNYTEARKKFDALFLAYIEEHKSDKKP